MLLTPMLLATPALAAFSPEQLAFVFKTTKGLKGNSARAEAAFDFTLVANSTHALCALQVVDGKLPGASSTQPGWIGIGSGAAMIGSDDLVFWQSTKGDWVVSRREPDLSTLTQVKDPGDAGAPVDGDFAIVPELSSSKGSKVAQVAFIRKLAPAYKSKSKSQTWKLAKKQSFVFARSSTVPDGDSTATLAFHDVNQGSFSLDLSAGVKATRNFGAGSVLSVKLPTAAPASTTLASLTPTKTTQATRKAQAETTKTLVREAATQKRNATVTSSAYDPNDTPDFCDLLAAKNATASGPCGKKTVETRPRTSSSLAPLATAPTADESIGSLANSTSPNEFSSASTLRLSMISMILMITPIFVLLR